MFNFDPETTIASTLPQYQDPNGLTIEDPNFAGVSFTIHRLTDGKRLKLRLDLAKEHARIRELMAEKNAAGTLPADQQVAVYARVSEELDAIVQDSITPARFRALVSSVQNLTIKGKPATPALLFESGPPELCEEIVKALDKQAGLTEKEKGESELPTTSSALADGQTSSSSAIHVVK